jgi:putative dimethyl sulfoxide reductase chaperone
MSHYDPNEAIAREDLCRFLSACYYEPCPEFAEENLFDSMLTAASRIHPELADDARKLGDAFCSSDLQALLVDYARLFLGPVQTLAKPYASCWLPPPAEADVNPSLAVLEMYGEVGFEIAEELRELPDHIAIELEFLYLLIFQCNEAQRSGEADSIAAAMQREHDFLGKHLGAWIAPFTGAMHAGAETGFYRQLAEMTERFVRIEIARVGASR